MENSWVGGAKEQRAPIPPGKAGNPGLGEWEAGSWVVF